MCLLPAEEQNTHCIPQYVSTTRSIFETYVNHSLHKTCGPNKRINSTTTCLSQDLAIRPSYSGRGDPGQGVRPAAALRDPRLSQGIGIEDFHQAFIEDFSSLYCDAVGLCVVVRPVSFSYFKSVVSLSTHMQTLPLPQDMSTYVVTVLG